MSPRTSDTDPATSKKYSLRLQIPVDDPDVEAFLIAQGVRFQSQAIVMLIRMWVNEFGPTNVLEQTMGAVTATALKGNQVSGPTPPPAAAPTQKASAPVPTPIPSAPVPEIAVQSESEPKPAPTSSPSPAAPSDDFEELFRS